MFRPIPLAILGLAVAFSLALAWTGASLKRVDESLRREIEALRWEVDSLHAQLRDNKKSPEGKDQSEESELIAHAQRFHNEEREVQQEPPGRITKMDPGDAGLAEVDLGKDAGLEKHATLEIFRHGPSSEYIGTLRVVEVYNQRALCRLVSVNPLKKQTIQIGDRVGFRQGQER